MIRQAVTRDADAIARLVREVGTLHAENRSDLFLENAVTADADKILQRILGSKYHVIVAEDNGSVIATMMAYRREIKDDIKFRDGCVLRIEEVVVDAAHRRTGVAHQMMAHMKEYAAAHSCCRIESNVWGFNRPSHAFFVSEGFRMQQETMELSMDGHHREDIALLYSSADAENARHKTRYKQIEFLNTEKYLLESIAENHRVLDCAAGNGRYAFALAKRGNHVCASDLSPANVAFMRQYASENHVPVRIYQDDAADLSRYEAACFDAVICMGPAYHMKRDELRRCIEELLRVLVPGGRLFISYLNKLYWGPYILKNKHPEYTLSEVLEMMETGSFSGDKKDFVGSAFYLSPAEAEKLCCGSAGCALEDHLTLDGNWGIAHSRIGQLSDWELNLLADHIRQSSRDPQWIASGKNNMIVLRKR